MLVQEKYSFGIQVVPTEKKNDYSILLAVCFNETFCLVSIMNKWYKNGI